jgi:type IV pilus biogenesis protein CpaD/CtpE
METRMIRNQRWFDAGLVVLAAAVVLTLGGCATQTPVSPTMGKGDGLEQRIESARTRADHEAIASVYEQQAGADKASSERHRGLARAYARAGNPRVPTNPALISHCETLARTYEQAADENLALAKMHRQLAAEVK